MPATTDRTMLIDASPATVFSVVTDFESYPSWQKEVKSAVVHERDDQDRPVRVTISTLAMGMTIDALVEVTYGDNTLEYHLCEPTQLITQQDAYYVFTPQGETQTELKLTMAVDLKWKVPEFMLNQLITKGVNDNIKAVKRVSEEA